MLSSSRLTGARRRRSRLAPLVFLNSDAASYINGVALPVDGGFLGGSRDRPGRPVGPDAGCLREKRRETVPLSFFALRHLTDKTFIVAFWNHV